MTDLTALSRISAFRRLALALAALLAGWLAASQAAGDSQQQQRDYSGLTGDVNRGFYVARLANCITCHRAADDSGSLFSGGLELETRVGTYYIPNITPHPEDGIGGWSLEDFARSLTEGLNPEGKHYYPAYPYTFYTRFTSQDIVDLWAALQSVPAVAGRPQKYKLKLFYRLRGPIGGWKRQYFDPGEYQPDPSRSEQWNRGRYLADGPAHCGACHTPRGAMGGRDLSRRYEGGVEKIGGNGPNIRTETLKANGWTEGDLSWSLRSGLMPNGDAYGDRMALVVQHGTRFWTNDDLAAIATYFFDLPANE